MRKAASTALIHTSSFSVMTPRPMAGISAPFAVMVCIESRSVIGWMPGQEDSRVNICQRGASNRHGTPFTSPVEAMPIALAGQFEVEYGETGTGPAVVLVHSS